MSENDRPVDGRDLFAPATRAFLTEGLRFAVLSTIDPDCAPHVAVVWYRLDPDGTIVVNSRLGRRWPTNLQRDGRVAMAVEDERDGYHWVAITGRVEETTDDQAVAQADIAEMARRYHASDPERAERLIARDFERQRRVSFRIRPIAVQDHLD